MTRMNLKFYDEDLHTEFKTKCSELKLNMQYVLICLIKEWLEEEERQER